MKPAPVLPGPDDGAVFRTLFDASPDALLLIDSDGLIRLANPSAARLLGYSADELTTLSADALVPLAIRPHGSHREAYAADPDTRPLGTQMDLVALRRDGSEVMVEIALSPLQDRGLPYVMAAMRNVGEYPRVKEALQRARYAEHLAQFGRLAVDAPDAPGLLDRVPAIAAEALQVPVASIALLDAAGQATRIAAGIGLLGHEAVGAVAPLAPGSVAAEVVAQERPVRVDDYRQALHRAGVAAYAGAGLLSEMAVPVWDRGRAIGLLVVRAPEAGRFGDVEASFLESLASMLSTMLQRASSEEALHHAARLESVGQLTGGVAHDFNNLLTVISGNLQMLAELPADADPAAAQQAVGAALRATRRGAELTAKLLAFSRHQVLQPTAVDTAALLRSLTAMLRRTLDERITIALDAEPAWCIADAMQLESALLNVAINARDAMPHGGTLALRSRAVAALPPELAAEQRGAAGDAVAAAGVHGYVAIAITDTGAGMPEAVREHAFEPFFTTKGAGRGTGLGLSTVYGFVTQSLGAVTLASVPRAGTTVTLYLPQTEPAGPPAAQSTPTSARLVPGLRVLMVEDDAEVRKVVLGFLDAMGCISQVCASAEEALTVLDANDPLDLLLSDVVLGPGMRGRELAEIARAQLPGLPVLLMSGYSNGLLDKDRGWRLLPKPFNREQLERELLRALAQPPH